MKDVTLNVKITLSPSEIEFLKKIEPNFNNDCYQFDYVITNYEEFYTLNSLENKGIIKWFRKDENKKFHVVILQADNYQQVIKKIK